VRDDMSNKQGITALLRQLGADGAALLRNEIALAKLELQDVVRSATAEGARIGAAVALAAVGGLAVVAGLILALGHLLHDHYATSAFIVGAIFLAVGALLARRAVRGMKSGALKAGETIETLQEDKQWIAQEVRDFKHQISERSS
jgi:uncharacterized membrane protein